MAPPNDSAFDKLSQPAANDFDVSSILSHHAMEIAATAGGGALGGATGWGASAAYGLVQRGKIICNAPMLFVGAALSQGGDGAVKAMQFTGSELRSAYAMQEARGLGAIGVGAVLGAAIAYGGYRWLTDDSKVQKA
jgi:hypothetical protein